MKKLKYILVIYLIIFGGSKTYSQTDSASIFEQTFIADLTPKDSIKSIQFLVDEIDNILKHPNLRNSKFSVAVYSLDQKKYLYTRDILRPLTPASNTKLVSSFAALYLLGKNYEVTTEIFTNDMDLKDSVINGDLYILGFGDAFLTTKDVENLADNIRKLGIKKITGNIYADGSFFDKDYDRFSYSQDKDEVVALAPITALSIENNNVTVIASSGSRSGQPLNIYIKPASEYFKVFNNATVGSNNLYENSIFDNDLKMGEILKDEYSNYYGDEIDFAQRRGTVRINTRLSDNPNKQIINVSGYLARNKTVSYRYNILKPELALAGHLKDRLESGDIIVEGGIFEKPDTVNINYLDLFMLTYQPRHLKEFVIEANKQSNNYIAEYLFRMLGGKAKLDEKTNMSARKGISQVMKDLDIPFEGCVINDGSGLSRRNLLTTASLIEIMKRAYDMGWLDEYFYTMALAGKDGTLEKRMRQTIAQENLYAKTGTLRNVSSLSGITTTIDGEKLLFSFIFNGNNVGAYKDIENQLSIILSQFFYFHELN